MKEFCKCPSGYCADKQGMGAAFSNHAGCRELDHDAPRCDCGKPVCERDEYEERCESCLKTHEENQAEAAYQRQQEDGECFRGGEYAAHVSAQQAEARRLK